MSHVLGGITIIFYNLLKIYVACLHAIYFAIHNPYFENIRLMSLRHILKIYIMFRNSKINFKNNIIK